MTYYRSTPTGTTTMDTNISSIRGISVHSWVYTAKGMQRIKDIKDQDEVYDAFGCSNKIKKITEYDHKTYEMTMESGRKMIASVDSQWLQYENEMKLELITQGSYLLRIPLLIRYCFSNPNRHSLLDYIYGRYLVQGTFDNNTDNVILNIHKRISNFHRSMGEFGLDEGKNYFIRMEGEDPCVVIPIKEVGEYEGFNRIEEIQERELDGELTTERLGILQGICDAKMIRCSKRIVLDLDSLKLSHQVQEWLWRLGIDSNLTIINTDEFSNPKYRISLHGKNINYFNSIVGSKAAILAPYTDITSYLSDFPLDRVQNVTESFDTLIDIEFDTDNVALVIGDYIAANFIPDHITATTTMMGK